MEQLPEKTRKVERLNEMPEEWRALREKILENFESKTDGLDIERVKDFMKERGLPITDFVIFDDEDLSDLQDLFGDKKIPFEWISKYDALYLPGYNLVFVHRRRELEKINGTVYTEGQFVHEEGHAAGNPEYFKIKNRFARPRSGFGLNRDGENYWGQFLEEGFADMLRGEYMKKNLPSEHKEKILKELENKKIPVHSGAIHNDVSGVENKTSSKFTYDVSIKYLHINEKTNLDYRTPSVAATGLEMLCEKQPKLKEVLFEARTDIEKLREIPRLINEIKPGLYLEIQKCLRTYEDFSRVQNIIKEAIQNSA
jgi:hypothetical protein